MSQSPHREKNGKDFSSTSLFALATKTILFALATLFVSQDFRLALSIVIYRSFSGGVTVKMKVWTLLDIALRVPPIFLMDKALKYEFRAKTDELRGTDLESFTAKNGSETYIISHPWITQKIVEEYGITFLEILLHIKVLLIAGCIFLFNTKQLLSIYIRLASAGIIILSYKLNSDFLNVNTNVLRNYSLIQQILLVFETIFIQFVLALLFIFTNSVKIQPQAATILLFLLPSLSHTFSFPDHIQKLSPVLLAVGCTLLLAYSMWIHGLRVCETIYRGITWCHIAVENYGLFTMIETHWINLNIPQVFRVFWLIRMTDCIVRSISNSLCFVSLGEFLKKIISDGSENIIALLGMASMISLFCQYFGYVVQKFLQVSQPAEKNIGTLSAILFLILSLQTGITSLTVDERCNQITRNLYLVYTAQLHFAFNILNPILMSLSVSRNPSLGKHIRALAITLFLIISPTIILFYQWKYEKPNTWLFALTSFMLELIIKNVVLLTVYLLFTIDTYKEGLWENLDDYVFYLKGASKFTEFVLGIYLLLNGLWIFLFESKGAIRVCMMCLHAYFNIWIQAKTGWECYMQRRSAQQKIEILQQATKAELVQNNDVCAICFQDMKTARVTKCHHFFHAVCLSKWLSVQDICPLCHTTVYNTAGRKESLS